MPRETAFLQMHGMTISSVIGQFKASAGEPWTCPRCLDGQLLWYDGDATEDLKVLYHKLACNRCGHVELITATRATDEEVNNESK
jgi:hypothetical protein